MARPTLGTVELIQSAFGGFTYEPQAQVMRILDDGSGSGGNAVLQGSGNGFRTAPLSFITQGPTDKETVRGYYEALTQVTFTDHDATDWTVYVTAFSATFRVGDLWDATVTLTEVP